MTMSNDRTPTGPTPAPKPAPKPVKPGLRARFRAWRRRHRLNILLATLILVFAVVVLADRIFVNIPSGSVGVLWLRLAGGTQTGFHYNPGLKIIAPWDQVFVYDVRLRRMDETVQALTRDGLAVDVELTVSYFVDRDLVANLHETLGPQFEDTLVRPTMSSEIRNAVAELRPDDLYSINRTALEQRVARLVRGVLARSNLDVGGDHQLINIQDIFIRNITLPPTVQASIEQKIAEEQNALRFQFVLEKERLESERKAIEAQGIRQFQEIVSNGISDRYLRWKGIDATLQLSKSPNAKVVVIGAQNGLPLILDTSDKPGADQAPAAGPRAKAIPPVTGSGSEGDAASAVWPPPLPDAVDPLDAGGSKPAAAKPEGGKTGGVKPGTSAAAPAAGPAPAKP
ncbi:prohibitin family protein [Nitrospirillum iridis]|uniref:Regulator of protease activity HflC (Stomatin/prohibitin superfamily) n=1 Tax=Nitrospirillum iridis TaxID=765888 RepID=A0A7X0B3G0_9PROT|nr:prohibitin family protein [Nitrospirillum iridis]MBB6254963.1 regulator of protease activity HflC (stomatin/prohibitin superfamily) [Nitrospirillum iridis]